MTDGVRAVAIPVLAGVAVFQALHIVLWRRRPSHAPRIYLMSGLIMVGLAASAALRAFVWNTDGEALFAVISIGAFADVLYMFFYCGLARSVSFTVLGRFVERPSERVPLSLIVDDYTGSSKFQDRLEVMRRSGWIAMDGDRVALTDRGLLFAKRINLISTILCGGLEG